jgi:hypothetical protein
MIQAGRVFLQAIPRSTATYTQTATATASATVTCSATATSTATPTATLAQSNLLSSDHFFFVPNPSASDTATAAFWLLDEADVTFDLYDFASAHVRSASGRFDGGIRSFVISVAGLPNGVYFARLRARASGGRSAEAVTKLAIVR